MITQSDLNRLAISLRNFGINADQAASAVDYFYAYIANKDNKKVKPNSSLSTLNKLRTIKNMTYKERKNYSPCYERIHISYKKEEP